MAEDDEKGKVMAEAGNLSFSASSAAALEPYLPPLATATATATSNARPSPTRPFVTLAFATSLDSSLSLAPGVRTRLSGPASKAMTHYLRSRHAAILIGVSTLLADDPGLNCRLAGLAGTTRQPRPVIVDPRARWTPRPSDKVLAVCRAGAGLAPFVLTGVPAAEMPADKARVLHDHGGKYIHGLGVLRAEGLASVMVEGGGQVINALLRRANHELVDAVIVTLAPTWLGTGGVVVSPERAVDAEGRPCAAARLCGVSWVPLGEDVVLCGRLADDAEGRR
ncbi:hypothetical protein E4U53_004340 [Claviceps sorghi]|nr:hypothetical protein E4U53_004340 [Claviceps sorghi]